MDPIVLLLVIFAAVIALAGTVILLLEKRRVARLASERTEELIAEGLKQRTLSRENGVLSEEAA